MSDGVSIAGRESDMAIKVYRDGRTVLTGRDYTEHKRKVWSAQGGVCAGPCGQYLPFQFAELDHAKPSRGMGGGKRDDKDPLNTVKCTPCHRLRHYRERDLAAVRA